MPTETTGHQPLDAVDRAWLRMDEPDNRMVITGLMFFEQMDLATLRQVLVKRLLRVRRFRQRLDRGMESGSNWVDDPHFDIDRHLTPMALPAPGGEQALQQVVGELMAEALPLDRPLWRFALVEGYKGGSVMVSRLHHAIGDGVGLMMVLLSLTDLDAESGAGGPQRSPFAALLDPDPAIRTEAAEQAAHVMPEVVALMRRMDGEVSFGKRALLGLGMTGALARLTARLPDPKTPYKGPLGVQKLVRWSRPVALADVKAIKERVGGTVNDVLVSAMTGALRRYLEHRGTEADGLAIRAVVPVSLRKLDELADIGNRFGMMFLPLPIGHDDRESRHIEVRKRMSALKRSLEAPVVLGFLRAMGRMPLRMQKWVELLFGMKATAVLSNVPGPRRTLYLGGQRIGDLLFWVPQSGRVGLGISILSYNDRVRLGLAVDEGLIPDPDVIVDAFHAEIDALIEDRPPA